MNVDERIEAYLEKVPPCVLRNGGDTHLYKVACALYNGFALTEAETLAWLHKFNEKCEPPWPPGEFHRLEHKASEAAKAAHVKHRGYLLFGHKITQTMSRVAVKHSPVGTTIKKYTFNTTLPTQSATDATHLFDTFTGILPNTTQNSNPETRARMLERSVACVADLPKPLDDSGLQNLEHLENCSKALEVKDLHFLALDIETYPKVRLGKTGKVLPPGEDAALSPETAEIRLVSFCNPAGEIELRDLLESPLTPGEMDILAGKFVAHNAEFEARFFKAKFGIVPQQVFCTLLASRLLSPGERNDLKTALKRHLGVDLPKDQGTSDWGAGILSEEQLEYSRNDVRYLLPLKAVLETKLESAGLSKIAELDNQVLVIVLEMERHGFPIDREAMTFMKVALDREAEVLLVNIRKAVGNVEFNPLSPKHVPEAFNVANNKEETLKRLAVTDPRATLILRYKKATKLSGRLKGDLEKAGDGRLHSKFSAEAITGRYTSAGPNLQNVTRGPLRSCFIPSAPDRRLISADYSQIELRVAALLAGDKVMIEAFKNKEDLHSKIMASIYNKPVSEVNGEERVKGKTINFSFIYGKGPEGFVRDAFAKYDLIFTLEEATQFQEAFFSLYSGLKTLHSEYWRKVDAGKNATRTVLGRPLLARSEKRWDRFQLLANYRVQGSCADLIKAAMLKTVSVLPREARLIATVHDELIFDAPADMAGQHCKAIEQAMIDAFVEMFGETVPVEVEAKVCNHWGDK